MYSNLAVLVLFAFAYSVIAGRVERSAVTGPIIFIVFGLIAGPFGFGLLDMDVRSVELRVVADLTLALVLFIDAANADLNVLRSHARIPRRMLLIGLPLCIALGAVTGLVIFPDISLYEVCILATMLAATDAALGKGLVSNKAVPARIREGLNAESGLNDGMCVPVLLVFLALALACFAAAQTLHGSGYIAAFVGGLLFGHFAREETHWLVIAGEGIAELLAMLTWLIFGAVVLGQSWAGMTVDVVIYSLLSLTVIRMLPNIIALTGSGEKLETKFFLAWFGPRGLASIVFFIIVANANLPGESVIEHVVVCTVTLCVIAHGLTANAWAKGISRRLSSSEDSPGTEQRSLKG